MTNPDVYPITAAFEKEFEQRASRYYATWEAFKAMAGNIGEYEHGSADVEDVFDGEDINLNNYVAVCTDILNTMIAVQVDRPGN